MLLQARQGIGHDWVVTARNGEHGYGWVTKTLHWLTFGLLVMLFVIPPTGLVVLLGDDDLLGLHIAAHIVFFVALATHLGLVLGRGLRGRPVLLRRML